MSLTTLYVSSGEESSNPNREGIQNSQKHRPDALTAQTFNPLFKMRPDYRWFYGIAAKDPSSSRWFDSAIKVDAKAGTVVASWSSPGIFMTEFDFLPRGNGTEAEDEDDGVLLTVLYNATSDASLFGVFDARELVPLGLYKMDSVVPFHAHGISCRQGEACFTNP